MTKNKYFKSVLCLGVGAVVLSAAVFANYDNANGYNVCKTAAKSILFERNFSADCYMEATLDSQKVASYNSSYAFNAGGNPVSKTEVTEENIFNWEGPISHYTHIVQDDQSIWMNTYNDGRTSNYSTPYYGETRESLLGGDEMTGKAINFAEKLCDTMVGDLKNSLVLADSSNGTRTYTISLSGEQLPELVSSGISLMVAGIRENAENYKEITVNGETYESLDAKLYDMLLADQEPYIESVEGTLLVNEQDKPVNVSGKATICGYDKDGGLHSLTLSMGAEFYDYGTTEMEKVDVSQIPDLEVHASKRYSGTHYYTITEDMSEDEKAELLQKAENDEEQGIQVLFTSEDGQITNYRENCTIEDILQSFEEQRASEEKYKAEEDSSFAG